MNPNFFIATEQVLYSPISTNLIDLNMNMYRIDPSLNKVMANIKFISYSNFLKNQKAKDIIPNTNVKVSFINLEQENFGKRIVSQQYFNLLKDFLFTYPLIVCEKEGFIIYKIEKGILQKANLIIYNFPIVIKKTKDLNTEDKLINLIKKSIENIDSMEITFLDNSFKYSESYSNICLFTQIQTKHPECYNIMSSSKKFYLRENVPISSKNNEKYCTIIFDQIKNKIIETYGSEIQFIETHSTSNKVYYD